MAKPKIRKLDKQWKQMSFINLVMTKKNYNSLWKLLETRGTQGLIESLLMQRARCKKHKIERHCEKALYDYTLLLYERVQMTRMKTILARNANLN